MYQQKDSRAVSTTAICVGNLSNLKTEYDFNHLVFIVLA